MVLLYCEFTRRPHGTAPVTWRWEAFPVWEDLTLMSDCTLHTLIVVLLQWIHCYNIWSDAICRQLPAGRTFPAYTSTIEVRYNTLLYHDIFDLIYTEI